MKRFAAIAIVLIGAAVAVWHPAPPSLPVVQSATPTVTAERRLPHAHKTASADAVVYVAGAVARPGLYRLATGARVDDAVRLAGGLRPEADAVAVNLAARLADGDEVAVPRAGEARSNARTPRRRSATRVRRSKAAQAPGFAVNVNTADARSLASVPGIGPAIAERIVLIRENDGPYGSLDQLLDVAGMTASKLDRVRVYLSL